MFISNEFKVMYNEQFNKEIRENFKLVIDHIIDNIILDKTLFDKTNFELIYYDEFELRTNCNKDIFSTLYLVINQPLNYKTSTKIKTSSKNNIYFPNLYYNLDEFIDSIYLNLISILDNNNIIWKEENSVCLKSTVIENNVITDYYFRVIPCIAYYNSNNIKGLMYKKNNGIEIEYVTKAIENYNKKNKLTNNIYNDTIIIFKNILLKNNNIKSLPKEIIETMLYNVPNNLFIDNSKKTLINIINFLRNNSIKNFKTIDEEDNAFTSIYRSMSLLYVKHIIKIIEKYLTKD